MTALLMTNLSRAIAIVLVIVSLLHLWVQIRSEKCAYRPLVQLHKPEGPGFMGSVENSRPDARRRRLPYLLASLPSPLLLGLGDSENYDSIEHDTRSCCNHAEGSSYGSKVWTALKFVAATAWIQKSIPSVFLSFQRALYKSAVRS